MTPRPLRIVARLVARALPRLARPRDRNWAEAMACESEHIAADAAAARFVLGCAGSLGRRRLASWFSERTKVETAGRTDRIVVRLAFACGATGMAAGLALMGLEGAPRSYLAVNALTGLLALITFPFLARAAGLLARRPAAVAAGLGALLLAIPFYGIALDGVARWVRLGPVALQLSFVALPVLVALISRLRPLEAAPAVLLAALALALQPDRAMSAALAAAVAVLASTHRSRGWAALFAICTAAVVAAALRPDPMPAVPFVDQLIPFAFAAHPALGVSIAAALLLPLLPFVIAVRRGSGAAAALAGLWLVATLAALVGHYPTPLVGYGASPILGYALSFAFITPARGARSADASNGSPSPSAGRRRSLWFVNGTARRAGRAV